MCFPVNFLKLRNSFFIAHCQRLPEVDFAGRDLLDLASCRMFASTIVGYFLY